MCVYLFIIIMQESDMEGPRDGPDSLQANQDLAEESGTDLQHSYRDPVLEELRKTSSPDLKHCRTPTPDVHSDHSDSRTDEQMLAATVGHHDDRNNSVGGVVKTSGEDKVAATRILVQVDVEPHCKEAGPSPVEVEPSPKKVESGLKDTEPNFNEVEPSLKEVESGLRPTLKEVEPCLKEACQSKSDSVLSLVSWLHQHCVCIRDGCHGTLRRCCRCSQCSSSGSSFLSQDTQSGPSEWGCVSSVMTRIVITTKRRLALHLLMYIP